MFETARQMARSVQGCRIELALPPDWGEFIRRLRYKTTWYGAHLHAADRWFPSFETCSERPGVHRGLALADRQWTCVGCGTTHDREVNASTNLLTDMLPVSETLELERGQVAA
ncbi:zinc ribbon domain-containing protein [Streptosporangium lutulentum]|uniref:Transposase n=1 Tax=Streptosporangium lutulentum TaxID=1461250 RepID=A0ABT9Q4R1_9ACTN|nr:zinc ribbon domain-containing protein [Streptosporangium lutulentum]MDP9841371.1 transposase [Streptosporangium lutulentum]